MKPVLPPSQEDALRPHSYDGIQEYDKRLPNWWLFTLYISIVFWVGYWSYYEWFGAGQTGSQVVSTAMARIEADRLASSPVDDASLWQMSQNPNFIAAGKAVFDSNCSACHLVSMRGKGESPAAIGPDLTDTGWVHGGRPTEVYDLISKGVLTKGMPTWAPVLGAKKIGEVTAYIMSRHKEGDPIVKETPPATP